VEDPGERELTRRYALRLGELLHPVEELEVGAEVLALAVRRAPPKGVLVEVVERADRAGEEAATERTVGDETDPQLASGGKDRVLAVAAPQRVRGLKRADPVSGVRAADGLRRRLRQPDVLDLALLD
jgi:hypothetical protein